MVFEKIAFYWLVCLVIVAVLLGVLRLLITLSGAQRRRRGFAGLHRDQQGSVQSLSFVMTLPVFIMIMMGIIQIGQIMLAKVVVEYAALASTRAATVWISQYTNAEKGLEEQRNCVGNESIQRSDSTYRIETENSKSSKINRIAMAAQLALLPICPSRWPYSDEPNLSGVATQTHASLVKAYSAMAGEKSNTPDEAISKRLKNKLAYSQANTKIEIEMEHPESDPPFRDYNYAYQVNPTYKKSENRGGIQINTVPLPPCPGSGMERCAPEIYYDSAYRQEAQAFQPSEVGWQDRITVTVRHSLALLPGPGKLLSKMIHGEQGTRSIGETVGQQQGNQGEQDETLYTWPLVAKASTINEGELSILRYEQFFILEQ
ncbi:MAG: TadE/TadG family type IV pilus assembly protein [Pirellulaceae bacterium]|nr:TadE/TadG family type IV pilus assembly protein [Pirellulaceae bacterium]